MVGPFYMEASPGAVPTSVTMVAMQRKSVFVELSFFELSFFGWGCGYVRADYGLDIAIAIAARSYCGQSRT